MKKFLEILTIIILILFILFFVAFFVNTTIHAIKIGEYGGAFILGIVLFVVVILLLGFLGTILDKGDE